MPHALAFYSNAFVKVSDELRLRSFWAKRVTRLQPVNAPRRAEMILSPEWLVRALEENITNGEYTFRH